MLHVAFHFWPHFHQGFPHFLYLINPNKRNNAENGSLHRAFEFFGFSFVQSVSDDPKKGLAAVPTCI